MFRLHLGSKLNGNRHQSTSGAPKRRKPAPLPTGGKPDANRRPARRVRPTQSGAKACLTPCRRGEGALWGWSNALAVGRAGRFRRAHPSGPHGLPPLPCGPSRASAPPHVRKLTHDRCCRGLPRLTEFVASFHGRGFLLPNTHPRSPVLPCTRPPAACAASFNSAPGQPS